MLKTKPKPIPKDNAIAKRAMEAIDAIDADAQQRKSEQVEALREVLRGIDTQIQELGRQRQRVEDTIAKVTGKAVSRRGRRNTYEDLRSRLMRWMQSHPGKWYTATELQREFIELERIASIAMFLKKPIADGFVQVDRAGGPRSTKYAALSR